MVKCLTDFSCWETIAKLAPIGTALIVLIAAIIALGAMWVQSILLEGEPQSISSSRRRWIRR
jgi:hypothetical protein